jgi:ligand-binding sensor domain-containing protein
MIGNDVSCIAVDANNTKWIASLNAGVSSFNDTIWTTYTQDLYGLCSKDVRSIAVDPGGYIWFGTIQYGLSCFNGKSWLTYNTEFAIDCVQSMAVDQKGYKWWTTYNIGMNKFGSIDSSNTHLDWNKYYGSTPDGIRINGVLSIFIDSKGDKWLGTKKDGIFKLEDGGSPGFHMTGKY